jgi:hypothetical protein
LRSSASERDVRFSPTQWTEFAKAVRLDRIPPEEQRDICIAIVGYNSALVENERAANEAEEKKPTRRKVDPRAKGLAALRNFIKFTRGLRQAFYSVQNYLKYEPLVNEAEQLSEKIYKFQELAQRELDKKSPGGRPRLEIRDALVIRLGVIYERLTGEKPKRAVSKNGRIYGRFPKFVYAIFRARGIDERGLPNAIAKAVQHAKNQH